MICAGKLYDTFFICELDFELDFEFEIELEPDLDFELKLDFDFERKVELGIEFDFERKLEFELELGFELEEPGLDFGLELRVGRYDFEEMTMTSREVNERNNPEANTTPHSRKILDFLVAEIFLWR